MTSATNAVLVDLNKIPQAQREALQREAIRRAEPIENMIVEDLEARGRRLIGNARRQQRPRKPSLAS